MKVAAGAEEAGEDHQALRQDRGRRCRTQCKGPRCNHRPRCKHHLRHPRAHHPRPRWWGEVPRRQHKRHRAHRPRLSPAPSPLPTPPPPEEGAEQQVQQEVGQEVEQEVEQAVDQAEAPQGAAQTPADDRQGRADRAWWERDRSPPRRAPLSDQAKQGRQTEKGNPSQVAREKT